MSDFSVEIASVMRRLEAEAERRLVDVVDAVASAAEREAKLEVASGGSHPKGTPTPAVSGVTGPAVVTGNLRRSIVRSRARRSAGSVSALVGVARSAPYGKHVEALGYEFMSKVPARLERDVLPIARRLLRSGWGPYR